MNDDAATGCLAVVGGLTLIGAFIAVVLFAATMEARAYNRVTGIEVTTWEAVRLELRVDGCEQLRSP